MDYWIHMGYSIAGVHVKACPAFYHPSGLSVLPLLRHLSYLWDCTRLRQAIASSKGYAHFHISPMRNLSMPSGTVFMGLPLCQRQKRLKSSRAAAIVILLESASSLHPIPHRLGKTSHGIKM